MNYAELHGRLQSVNANDKTLTSLYSKAELAMILKRHSVPANRNKPELVLELMRLMRAGQFRRASGHSHRSRDHRLLFPAHVR